MEEINMNEAYRNRKNNLTPDGQNVIIKQKEGDILNVEFGEDIKVKIEQEEGDKIEVLLEEDSEIIIKQEEGDKIEVKLEDNTKIETFEKAKNGVENDITSDAWGRGKSILDNSVFHGLFSFDIPLQQWLLLEDGVEVLTSTKIIAENGEGVVKSGDTQGDYSFLRSKRHPRYQPNRGHLFSTALFLPVPEAIGIRQFGMKNTIGGVYFQLEDGKLYAVILDNSIEKVKQEIDLGDMTIDDLKYGNLFDIQFQWRGVGDYFFYINQKLVYKTNFLGTQTSLTTSNPAFAVGFYSENTDGTEVEIRIGCVDVTSEGGEDAVYEFVSFTNPVEKAINTLNYPVIIVRAPLEYKGKPNTRDSIVLGGVGSADQRVFAKGFITRDPTAITGANYQTVNFSSLQYDVSATAFDGSKATQIFNRRIQQNSSEEINVQVPFYVTPGDYIILTMNRENVSLVANVLGYIKLGEEI